ncbi:MAG: zinc dependent phospholipase C family protein [Syntrophus sp. (in: bacteria)]
MPGAYAHITAVNVARERLEEQKGFPREGLSIVSDWLKYIELGSVGPDYPYLDVVDGSTAAAWADAMHWDHTGDRIKVGIRVLTKMPPSLAREKALAWLLGFTAHVLMDVTLHPMVGIKVGPYEENKKAHRTCEMNQDTYIFQTRMNLEIHYASYLKAGICRCSDPADEDKIDPDIFYVWNQMFKDVDLALYMNNGPRIDVWHNCFEEIVDHIAENRLVALARHVAPKALDGSVYPLFDDIDRQYINNLEVPGGQHMDYDNIFDKGVSNVVRGWAMVASDVLSQTNLAERFLRNWNLDTGEDESKVKTFWSVK